MEYKNSIQDKYIYSRLRKRGWSEDSIALLVHIQVVLASFAIVVGVFLEMS
jgi:hypothetical protein